MPRSIDFNSLTRPHISFTMRDAEHTTLRVTLPSEGLIRRFETSMGELTEVLSGNNEDSVKAAWELLAELFSFNLEHIKVTADDLTKKYGLYLEDMVILCGAYLDFLGEVTNAKN